MLRASRAWQSDAHNPSDIGGLKIPQRSSLVATREPIRPVRVAWAVLGRGAYGQSRRVREARREVLAGGADRARCRQQGHADRDGPGLAEARPPAEGRS